MIRLGGPVPYDGEDADEWVAAVRELGYRATYCPNVSLDRPDHMRQFKQAAEKADIWIAEVGAWSNPISKDATIRAHSIQICQKGLALAEELGAHCCVNIAGSLSDKWDGPHPDHFSDATFDLIVESVREIIDAVKPKNTFYTLEMMPWMLPDSAESYVRLIKAIDRSAFGVHIDPVNVVTGPRILYDTGKLLRELIGELGPWIKSCHAKDVIVRDNLTLHLDEARPGLGYMDYRTYLSLLNGLGRDIPLMLEHLPNQDEYRIAANFVRGTASELGISI